MTIPYPNKPREFTQRELLELTPAAIDLDIQEQLLHALDCAIVFITNMGFIEPAKELANTAELQKARMEMQQHNQAAINRILDAIKEAA